MIKPLAQFIRTLLSVELFQELHIVFIKLIVLQIHRVFQDVSDLKPAANRRDLQVRSKPDRRVSDIGEQLLMIDQRHHLPDFVSVAGGFVTEGTG